MGEDYIFLFNTNGLPEDIKIEIGGQQIDKQYGEWLEILSEFRKRILNSVDEEFNEAIIKIVKIANLRLNKINIKHN